MPHSCITYGWPAADKKRAETKEQQLKGLLARIDALQAEKQQLQEAATAAQERTSSLNQLLSKTKCSLMDARKQHQQELDALKQQLENAQQELQRTHSSGLNNAAELEAVREQARSSQSAADAAKAELSKAQQEKQQAAEELAKANLEKQLLLANMQQLLKLNKELQQSLAAEREKKVGCTFVRAYSL